MRFVRFSSFATECRDYGQLTRCATDKVGACCNVGAWQLRDLVSERGVGLPHDGTGRFGFGASLLAFAVLREDLIPLWRQEDAGVVGRYLGCCGHMGRHG